MEVFSLYVLSFLAVFISFSIAFLRQSYEPKRTKLPPGSFGFPVVGETLHYYLGGPENFIRKRMDKYSEEVFKTSMVGENVAVVCGAAGNKFLLYNANDVVVPWIPATASKFLTWADSPGKSSSTKYALSKVRSFLHSILRPDAMRQYVPIMDSIARQHLKADWEPFQEVKVYPLPQKYTLSLACKLILGLEDVSRAQSLSESFRIAMQGVFSIPINFPGTIHYRALKEIRKVKHGLLEIILERKKLVLENRERVGSDILSRILLDENTRSTTDSEIALYLLSLMLPSYESTSSSITIVLKYLAELPQIYNMVFNGTY